jgi:hypothetical protein
MSQDNVHTEQVAPDATRRSRHHYAALVDKYFEYAHGNRLEGLVRPWPLCHLEEELLEVRQRHTLLQP